MFRLLWWKQSLKGCPKKSQWMSWAWSVMNSLLHLLAAWMTFRHGQNVLTIQWPNWSIKQSGKIHSTLRVCTHYKKLWLQDIEFGAHVWIWLWILENLQFSAHSDDPAGSKAATRSQVRTHQMKNTLVFCKILQFLYLSIQKTDSRCQLGKEKRSNRNWREIETFGSHLVWFDH